MHTLRKYALVAVLAAGCAAPTDQVDQQSSPILGGTPASAGQYPTVVAIVNNSICTGTLVAPNLVLTAAHCVSPSVLGYSNQNQVTNATQVVFDSTDIYGSSGFGVDAAMTQPNPSFNINALGSNDIGVIQLAQSITDRTPTAINRIHNDAPIGVTTTLIGYGMTDGYDQNSAGSLNVLTNKSTVSCNSSGMGSDSNLLCYNQSDGRGSCSGDSGGPAFATIGGVRKVVGVTSFGDQYCQQYGAYTRVDAELDFVDQYLTGPDCSSDGVCVEECGSTDPDCVDCSSDGVCVSECGSNGLPEDPDCPKCVSDGVCVEECGSGGYPSDPDCPTCVADGECEVECGANGLPADPDCPTCVNNEDCGNPDLQCVDGQCVAIPDQPAEGELGSTCEQNEDCVSGMCAAGPDGMRCSEYCDPAASTCPSGFDCLPAGSGGACWPSSGGGGGGATDPDPDGQIVGGCGVGGHGSSSGLALFLIAVVFGCCRRRRRSS